MTGFIYRAVSGDQIAQLIGAEPGEVIAADKTSINLFKVLGAALGLRTGRAVIVSEQENFPTDLYIAQGIATFLGGEHGLRLVPIAADKTSINLFKVLGAALGLRTGRAVIVSEQENFPTDLYIAQGIATFLGGEHGLRLVPRSELDDALRDDVAVVALTHVDFKTGDVHDMAEVTRRAQDAGALVVWDLSHSAGALPVELNAAGADFAVGCGYKYLNGGPGAPAFVFVAKRHQDHIDPPLSGWMGHEAPFAFDTDYRPAPGIDRQLCGTPSILAMAALEVGVEIAARADMKELRKKSQRMGDFFLELVEAHCDGYGLEVACPRDSEKRGSQVSLRHEDGYPIMQALIANGVIGDFRAPDVLRFGFTPLYLSYRDVWDAAFVPKKILETDVWRLPEFQKRQLVT